MAALSYRMLQIDGAPAGLLGLEELFAAIYADGLEPTSPELSERLLAGLRQHNFVPRPASQAYANTLTGEYARWHKAKKTGKAIVARDYGKFRGWPREQIPWFPTLSRDLCTDCGACMELCAREVFEKDEAGHIWVAEPFMCMVGCCLCKGVCEPKALLFPSQDILKNYGQKM